MAVFFKLKRNYIIFTTKKIGDNGEIQAENYLKKLGYKIIEKNWKYSRIGEIDLIAKDKDTIVFVEVKTRSSKSFATPAEFVDNEKISRITRVAEFFIKHYKCQLSPRIDVIEVYISLIGDKYTVERINHLENISVE